MLICPGTVHKARIFQLMPFPRLLIFDCDGVLVDSELVSLGEARKALQGEGLVLTLDEVREHFLGLSGKTMLEYAEARLGRSLPPDFHAVMTRSIINRFETELEGIGGIREAIEALGRPACVASSSTPERIRRSLDIVGYRDLFEPNLFSAQMVARGKPWPDLFLHAAKTFGTAPGDCLVIEDSVPGVIAACRAGIPVYGFTGGSHLRGTNQARRLLEAGAALTFEDMRHLPRLIGQQGRPQMAGMQPASTSGSLRHG